MSLFSVSVLRLTGSDTHMFANLEEMKCWVWLSHSHTGRVLQYMTELVNDAFFWDSKRTMWTWGIEIKMWDVKYHIYWYRHFLSHIVSISSFFCWLWVLFTKGCVFRVVLEICEHWYSDLRYTYGFKCYSDYCVRGANRGASQLSRILTLEHLSCLISELEWGTDLSSVTLSDSLI